MSLVRYEPSEAGSGGRDAVLMSLPFPAALVVDRGGGFHLEDVNERLSITLAAPRASLFGRPLSDALPATIAKQFASVANQCASAGAPIRLRGYDTLAPFDVIATPSPMEDRFRILILLEPLFQRQVLDPGQQTLFEQLGPLSRGMLYIYDPQRRCHRYMQGEIAVAAALPPGQISDVDLFERVHDDDAEDLLRHMGALSELQDTDVAAVTFRLRVPDNRQWIWMHARSRVLSRKPDGTVRRIVGLVCDVTEERHIADQLTRVSAALAQAEESERRRIGRELHDSTAQLLVAMGLGVAALERRVDFGPEAQRILNDVRDALGSAQREIRNFSYMLHPPALRDAGLSQAIREFASGFGRRTGLEISVDLPERAVSMPEAVELAVFRVAQEALMNTFRHANASRAHVRLRPETSGLVLEVEDDGVGMTSTDAPGVGIAAMRARMQQLGGDLRLGTGGLGFRVAARLPWPVVS